MSKHILLTCPKCRGQYKAESLEQAEKSKCPKCGINIGKGASSVSDEMTMQEDSMPVPKTVKGELPGVGASIAGCRLQGKVGQGGMGAVFKSHHQRLDKTVAVKLMTLEATSDEHRKRFLVEAQAAAKLEHPNIVQVYDVGEENGVYYIIMQFVEGESLERLVKKEGGLEPKRAARILREIALALKSAHDRNFIHRDVKPDNVFIGKNDSVKLGDFGLVRNLASDVQLTQAGIVLGTPYFMAPEQFQSDKIDRRADIYALGITFYNMLTNRRPFDGKTPYEVMEKHLKQPMPDVVKERPDVPVNVAELIARMTAKKPEERPQSIDEVLEALDDYVGEKKVVIKRSPLMIGSLAVLLVLLGVVVFMLVQSRSQAEHLKELLARGGIENVDKVITSLSNIEEQGVIDDEDLKKVKTEASTRAAEKIDEVVKSEKLSAEPEKVKAVKRILSKLDYFGFNEKDLKEKKKKFVAQGHWQTNRISNTRNEIDTPAKEETAKRLLEAYTEVDDDLDAKVRRVLSEIQGISSRKPDEDDPSLTPEYFEECKQTANTFIQFGRYRKAENLVRPFLGSKNPEIKKQAVEIMNRIRSLQKPSDGPKKP